METERANRLFDKMPKTKKEISKILGTIQWFRKVLKNASLKTEFLSRLLRKEVRFEWTSEET